MLKKFNLQFFAEDSEESVDTPVESSEETVESTTDESQTDVQEETTPNEYADLLSAINGKAVYKGEPMNIESFDDVIARIQKSENYDQTFERMNEYKSKAEQLENSAQRKFMNKFLSDNGYETFEDYETALSIDELVKEGMSEERAREHIEGQKALNTKKEAARLEQIEHDKKNLNDNNHADAIKWFSDKGYGELTSDKITETTWNKVADGVPLRYALMEQMFDNVKGDTEQDVLKKLQNKKDSSMGSVTSTNEKQTKGFGEMSSAEFKKIQEQVENGTYKKSFR